MDDDALPLQPPKIMLPQIGVEVNGAVVTAHVLIIGMGGLGSPVAMYLAAAGIGTTTLVDDDDVDLSNLQRQIVRTTERHRHAEDRSAALTLQALNPDTTVHPVGTRLHDEALLQAVDAAADAVVDCNGTAVCDHLH